MGLNLKPIIFSIFRRGNDRRGDRMGRDMEYRKDEGHDRNIRERDQSKGRQLQFHDDYQGIFYGNKCVYFLLPKIDVHVLVVHFRHIIPDQGFRDRRGDRSRYGTFIS